MKNFLTEKEIDEIIAEAKNPIYRQQNVITLGRKKTDIVRISPLHELIFINGNKDTGFIHINQRHLQFQEIPKWGKPKTINGLKYFQLDKPSYFHSSIIPIFDYPKIADSIYKPEHLDTINNKTSQFIDLYSGYYCPKNYDPAPYRLFLYKNTKIVHNLFPCTDQFSPTRILNYRKGSVKATHEIAVCKVIIEVPYYDHNIIARYKIIFERDESKMKEQIFIHRFHPDGKLFEVYFVSERDLQNSVIDQYVLWAYEFGEYQNLENIIDYIEKH